MTAEQDALSTSALAKALHKTTKQMFSELEALGWIERQKDSWQLTAKGEYEGGSYRESSRFGRYIIWPATHLQHPVLAQAEDQHLGVTQIARRNGLETPHLNALFHNLGWIRRARKGWRVTTDGKNLGGVQRFNETSGAPYVVWPASLAEHPRLQDMISLLNAPAEHGGYPCLDGHKVSDRGQQKIDNWLYLSGLAHACHHLLPFDERLYADFYLPESQVYIEYWGEDCSPGLLAEKMRKKTLLTQHQCRLVELQSQDLENLPERLSRLLLNYDVEI